MSTETTLNVTPKTAADEAHSFAEYKAVEAALQPYIESAKTGDGALCRTAFYDHAHIVGSVHGTFYDLDADTFQGAVNETGASPDVQSHISWIDISGPAASAKVEFLNWAGFRYTDFFVLYKQDGQWKISGKVYDSHAQN
ncbi:nuclear transport factor 2 family protein [Acaryochloris marina]|uniref:nuclear transport factor 2 family protein n=1 Tax=Acaryochloris marina TaxID=155978 RepID=UPI001BAF96AD|nr:nuclear transport factor 2 family protein [Acaryochloris marina]QUY42805.1 nuclear transport factor 2 family protein [Acaryochloris marina S15]